MGINYHITIKCIRKKTPDEIKLMKQAVKFFLNSLFHHVKTPKHVHILILLKNKKFVRADDGSENYGLCHSITRQKQKVFVITVADIHLLSTLSTLAHECVHIFQYVTKQLKYNNNDGWIWHNKSYGKNAYEKIHVDNELPWEYDAYIKEQSLILKFVNNYFST